MKTYKVGDYITYKVTSPGSEQVFHASGTIESVEEQNGNKQYLVAEGNGGAQMRYVDPNSVVTLLNE